MFQFVSVKPIIRWWPIALLNSVKCICVLVSGIIPSPLTFVSFFL